MQVLTIMVLVRFVSVGLPFTAGGHDKNSEQCEVQIPTYVFLTKTTPSVIVCEHLCLYSSRCVSSRWDRSTRDCQLYSQHFHKALRIEARRSSKDILMRKLQEDVKPISHVCSGRPCAGHEMCVPVEAGLAYLCLVMSDNVTVVTREVAIPYAATLTTPTAATTKTAWSTFLTPSFSVASNSLSANVLATSSVVTAPNTLSATVTASTASATPHITASSVRTIATYITASFTSTKTDLTRATMSTTASSSTSTSTATSTFKRTTHPTATSYPVSLSTTAADAASQPLATLTSKPNPTSSSAGTTFSVASVVAATTTTTPAFTTTTAAATTTTSTTTTTTPAFTTTTAAATTTTTTTTTITVTTANAATTKPCTLMQTTEPFTKCLKGTKKIKVSQSYVGCYEDNRCRILPHAKCVLTHMTTDKCLFHCHVNNYTYFGIEEKHTAFHVLERFGKDYDNTDITLNDGFIVGHECFCGDVIPESATKVPDKQCSSLCMGLWFTKSRCGGLWRISVFKIG